MFQLEQAIGNWRRAMQQGGRTSAEDVAELESHLRDEIEQLAGRTLDEEEAFLVATHRLGTPPELSAEYSKVNAGIIWARRLFWMLAGYVMMSLALSLLTATVQWVSAGALVTGLVDSASVRLALQFALLAAVAAPVVILFALPDGRRFLVSTADRMLVAGQRHPAIPIILTLLLYLGVRAAGFGRQMLVARLVNVEALGQEAYYGMYFGMVMMVLVPVAVLTVMGLTYRSLRGRGA